MKTVVSTFRKHTIAVSSEASRTVKDIQKIKFSLR